MSIENILEQSAIIEEQNKADLGVRAVFDLTPEKCMEFPHSLRYPVEGDLDYSEGGPAISIHRFRIEVRVCRGHLPSAEELARPLIKKYRDLYAQNMRLNESCLICRLIGYSYGSIEAGGETYLGVLFDVEAKESETITTGR